MVIPFYCEDYPEEACEVRPVGDAPLKTAGQDYSYYVTKESDDERPSDNSERNHPPH